MDKTVGSASEAVTDIFSGSSLAVGGFGLCGVPESLIESLLDTGADDLRTVSNNCGVDQSGLSMLLGAKRISRTTGSYVGENKESERQFLGGRSKKAWWSVNDPTNACSSALILARVEGRASCARTRGSRSPATSWSITARPETPKMSDATTDNLIWASSSSFSTRFFSRVRSAISATR